MSRKYKIYDQAYPYFITSTIIEWIDLFTRNEYRDIIIKSLEYCRKNKGLLIFAYCIMTNHIHLIVGSRQNSLTDIIRDFKSFTSQALRKEIENNIQESRRKWILEMMIRQGMSRKSNNNFQLWQHHYHPVQLDSTELINQKIEYLHMNPVKAGFVERPEDYLYSSARNYAGMPAVMEIDEEFWTG